jgi:UPF0271 protein
MDEWVPLGDRAVRFLRPAGAAPAALLLEIRRWPGVIDVVVGSEDVAVYFDDVPSVEREWLAKLTELRVAPESGRLIEIPADYDGDDLEFVARHAGVSADEVVRIHSSSTYRVDSMGFAPGFAYLVGVDPRLHVPRLTTPRTRVRAGAIGLAAGFTGVYPFESPAGWSIIGHTPLPMFNDEGARLRLGDRVRFVR